MNPMAWIIEYTPKGIGRRTRMLMHKGKPIIFNTFALAVAGLQTVLPSTVDIGKITHAGVSILVSKENKDGAED